MTTETVEEYHATDWKTLLDLLYQDAWNERRQRYQSPYVFRGIADSSYNMHSSLKRFVGDARLRKLELRLLRDFNRYARKDIKEPRSVWHLMAIAQHHGLPTRLLDWTSSPMIAAYFAVLGSTPSERDGVVWAVNYRRVHELLPDAAREVCGEALSEIPDISDLEEIGRRLARENGSADAVPSDWYGSERIHRDHIQSVLDGFSSPQPDAHALFFEPPAIDDRIVNQRALFSVLSDPDLCFKDWLRQYPDLCYKVVIPAECKTEFHDKLNQANITQWTMFPGLDGLANWLKEQYRPRHAARENAR